jgi:hypothetical protein
LNERKKQSRTSGKGHNETLELANAMELREPQLMPFNATRQKIVEWHKQHVILSFASELAEKSIAATNETQKPTSSQIISFDSGGL